jgi:2-haloacid dehalogenase
MVELRQPDEDSDLIHADRCRSHQPQQRMALRAKLPWTVIVGSDATRAYKPTRQAYRNMAWMLRLAPGEVMLAAAHNRDLTFAQRAGFGTAFIPRPTELGPGQTKDLTAEGDWDLVCASILNLAGRFVDADRQVRQQS